MSLRKLMVCISVFAPVIVFAAAPQPWSARADCPIAASGEARLSPQAFSALIAIGVNHRITQTLNSSTAASNYHGPDLTLNGKTYTAAVDLSVRCLDAPSIKKLLSQLADHGFAAWYRENGKDGWKGANHIHAVWAAEPLKPQLRNQVESWLNGRTGLVGNAKYEYWQPSEQERAKVSAQYAASKSSSPPKSGRTRVWEAYGE